jgi:hypothetical protein
VLWARSYRACDVLVRPRGPTDRVCVTSEFGKLVVEVEAPQHAAIPDGWEYFDSPLPRRWPVPRGTLGFDLYGAQVTHYVRLPPTPLKGVAMPYWFLVLFTATLPTAALARLRRRATALRRASKGLCARCGYDLRASPARCPECGSLTPSPLYSGERAGVRGAFQI